MVLDLADFERKARAATMAFWGNRQKALEAKIAAGTTDTGERGAVTAGNTMDGLAEEGGNDGRIHRDVGALQPQVLCYGICRPYRG